MRALLAYSISLYIVYACYEKRTEEKKENQVSLLIFFVQFMGFNLSFYRMFIYSLLFNSYIFIFYYISFYTSFILFLIIHPLFYFYLFLFCHNYHNVY